VNPLHLLLKSSGLGEGRWNLPISSLCLRERAQHIKKRTYMHASSGIRSQDHNVRLDQEPIGLRPLFVKLQVSLGEWGP